MTQKKYMYKMNVKNIFIINIYIKTLTQKKYI